MKPSALKIDAITLVAASQHDDTELTAAVLERQQPTDLAKAVADIAALLVGDSAAKKHIVGYLDLVGGKVQAKT